MSKFLHLCSKIILVTALCLGLSACSAKSTSPISNSHTKKTVALITDNSGVDDNSFNESAWQGIKNYARTHNLSRGASGYELFSATSNDQISALIDQASQSSYKTIFGVGTNLQAPILTAAQNYPKKNYVLINSSTHHLKNVAAANFNTKQGAYLAGVVAAQMTKTNKIGFIGGTRSKSVAQFEEGFEKGIHDTAKKHHKNIQIFIQYNDSFSNVNKAQDLAQNMYSKKADIIFHAAGKAGNGVFKAAREINEANAVNKKVWVIGADRNQEKLGVYQAKGGQESNFTLTSVVSRIALAIEDIANQTYLNDFPAGKTLNYNLSNDGVYIVHNADIPTHVWIASQKAKQNIINHKIKI